MGGDIRGILEARARLFGGVRAFFAERGFLEVSTPVAIPANAPEANIDALAVEGGRWFRTSPELHMKRLLAAGSGPIYQIAPCARKGERGAVHREEFLLLEWYRPGGDEREILEDAKALVEALARSFWGGEATRRRGEVKLDARACAWKVRTVREAFLVAAGWDPVAEWDADRFDLDLVDKVEPSLPKDHPVVLAEYPAAVAALAKKKEGDPRVARRWEMYWGGVELMNTFCELTDPVEQRRRFEEENETRARRGAVPYPIDEDFLEALGRMPPSGGTALGLERLLMLLTGAEDLGGVRALE